MSYNHIGSVMVTSQDFLLLRYHNDAEGAILFQQPDVRGGKTDFRFVNSTSWTFRNTQVACRQFGYNYAISSRQMKLKQKTTISDVVFKCLGYEHSLANCERPWNMVVMETTSDLVAGILCGSKYLCSGSSVFINTSKMLLLKTIWEIMISIINTVVTNCLRII